MEALKTAGAIWAVIFLFFLPDPVCARDILFLGNYQKPPKIYLENGNPSGILIDIMAYVDRQMADTFRYELHPWKRAYNYALEGRGGILGFSKNRERSALFDYSDVMFYDELVLVVLKGNEFVYNRIEDLKGKKVGALMGASYGEMFERGRRDIFQVDEDTSEELRLIKLLYGRIDVAIIGPGKTGFNRVISRSDQLSRNRNRFVILPHLFQQDPNFLGFAKSMHMIPFLEEFNRILEQAREQGVIRRITEKYVN